MDEEIKATRDEAIRTYPFPDAVAAEREYQRHRWGNDHDDDHVPSEWALMVLRYAGRLGERLEQALFGCFEDDGGDYLGDLRADAVKLGAVCAALVERLDRKIEDLEDARQDYLASKGA